jgi:hypothetical protein
MIQKGLAFRCKQSGSVALLDEVAWPVKKRLPARNNDSRNSLLHGFNGCMLIASRGPFQQHRPEAVLRADANSQNIPPVPKVFEHPYSQEAMW